MPPSPEDPTDPIRLAASRYPGVDEGTACTQSSFKAGGKAFLYIGRQGGRFKAMFKLKESLSEAETLARSEPDDYQVGSGAWVTARFTAERPMPAKRWKKWLDESYAVACPATGQKTTTARRPPGKKPPAKKPTAKKASRTKPTPKKRR